MPKAGARYESSRPCPQCGRDVDLSRIRPGSQGFCRNTAGHATGRNQVLRRRQLPPAWKAQVAAAEAAAEQAAEAAAAADPVTRWDAELPGALHWQAQLGPECPEADRCDSCACSSPVIRWTLDHTATVCPECGPADCWDSSPGAYDRGRAHAAATAVIARTASTPAAQLDLDRAAREFERQRARVLDYVDRQLAVPGLVLDSRSDLRWYRQAVEQASTPARLVQLARQMTAETWEVEPVPLTRQLADRGRGWLARFRRDDYDQDDYDQDDYDQDDDEPEPEPEQPEAASYYPGRGYMRALPGHPWTDADYQREAQRRADSQQAANTVIELREWNRRASGV